jgi:phage nucleotide-binding protein
MKGVNIVATKTKAKVNPTTEDIDLDSEDLDMDSDLVNEPVVETQSASGLAVMDFSEFEGGIEEITRESEDFVKALIYGANGTGKTTVAGTFPGPRLILDLNERGTKALVGTKESKKRFVDTFDLFQMSYWYLKTGNHPFKTVVLDNVTTLQELAMKFVMGKESVFDSTKDMDMPTKRDWGGLSQLMKRWLVDFRNLPMNVVFIAQEKREEEEDIDLSIADDDKDPTVFPMISKSARSILGGAVDLIGYTYKVVSKTDEGVVKKKFGMRLVSDKHVTKIRTPIGAAYPTAILNPNYTTLKKIMDGEWAPPQPKSKIKK